MHAAQTVNAARAWLDQRIVDAPDIDAELFARLTDAQRRLGLLHGDRPICPFLRPHLLARTQYDEIARAAVTLAGAFERLVECALRDDALFAELDATEAEARMARLDPGYAGLCVTSRLDAYLTETGFQFLEYNAESPAGLADQIQLEQVLLTLPHMRDFLARYPHWLPRPHARLLRALAEAYRRFGGRAEERPQIAIVDWDGVDTESEFVILRDYFIGQGYPSVIADPHALAYDGAHLYAGDFRIDVLYKRVIIHEYLARFDDTHALARAYADGKVCMANSFRAKLAHKKLGFAILSDERYAHLFTDAQRECVRRHVPWTRRVRAGVTDYAGGTGDLLDIARREQSRLVLKPNDDYGGHGVVIGWETDAAEWARALEAAQTQAYVVQERVPVRKIHMPTYLTGALTTEELIVDFDPFLFFNEVEGGLVRLSASSLCNISSGGGETALLVLEDA